RRHAGRRRSRQHRSRSDQREHPRGRRSRPHARSLGRHAALPRRLAARKRTRERGSRAGYSGRVAARRSCRLRERARRGAGGRPGAEARRMIEINLIPGKKKAAKGAGFQLALPDFKGLIAQVKDPFLIGAIAAWVVVGGGGALLFITDRARLAAAESRLENIRTEKRRYDIVIAQKRQAEKVRDSLLYQINVIRDIDADRYIWPHVLDQATKALP